jgi:hypothetical protein
MCIKKATYAPDRCFFATLPPVKSGKITHFLLDKKRPLILYSGGFSERGTRE